jgi:hypothetical protein
VDFTREPIIETVITPKEGYRLVVRSSKGAGYEEHFVDALEVVSFGTCMFFRCLERPKPFMVPVSDYEVLEVREPRMVLKTPSEQASKAPTQKLKVEPQKQEQVATQEAPAAMPAAAQEGGSRSERRRDRRRGFRRRRGQGREDGPERSPAALSEEAGAPLEEAEMGQEATFAEFSDEQSKEDLSSTPMLSSILPPPKTLIRDDLERLRKEEHYKGAFFIREGKDFSDDEAQDDDDAQLANLGTTSEEDLSFREAPFEISEEDIRMSEGGDPEVPQEDPFRSEIMGQQANSGSSQDVQKDL